jgi:hypothetical protein
LAKNAKRCHGGDGANDETPASLVRGSSSPLFWIVKAFENGKRHKPEEIIGQLEAGKNWQRMCGDGDPLIESDRGVPLGMLRNCSL